MPRIPRKEPTLANYRDRYVLMSGGINTRIKGDTSSVDIYSVEENLWYIGPAMNAKRCHHSMCVMESGHVYVIGGRLGTKEHHNNVECLDAHKLFDVDGLKVALKDVPYWQEMRIYPHAGDIPMNFICNHSLFAPFTADSLLVLGGLDESDDPLDDGYILKICGTNEARL